MAPPFERSEYAQRLTRTRGEMHDAGIDLLLVTSPDNMNYLCGYDAWSFYVPQVLLVPAADEEPVWIGRGMDSVSTRLTTYLSDASILSYADDYVENPAKHPMEHVARVISERGWDRGRIGYEGDAYFFAARWLQVLEKSLPKAKFVDAYLLVNWVRTVKSAAEIEVMRQAARIVEHTMWIAIDAVEVGRRQCDAAARISFAQIEGTPEFGGNSPANPPSILSGENSATPHAAWSDEPSCPTPPPAWS
jgi:Xaa-Pro aminopeptidase